MHFVVKLVIAAPWSFLAPAVALQAALALADESKDGVNGYLIECALDQARGDRMVRTRPAILKFESYHAALSSL
jgi:hypothetical protein